MNKWLITFLVSVALVVITAFVNELIMTTGTDDLIAVEQERILSILDIKKEDRLDKLCEYYMSNFFLNEDVVSLLESNIAVAESTCTKSGVLSAEIPKEIVKRARDKKALDLLNQCWKTKTPVTHQCTASRKKQLFGSRSSSCVLKLEPGQDRIFVQDQVFVESEYYRRIDSETAKVAVKATTEGFKGQISCRTTNTLGSRCKVSAEVKAISFSKNCVEIQDLLKEALL